MTTLPLYLSTALSASNNVDAGSSFPSSPTDSAGTGSTSSSLGRRGTPPAVPLKPAWTRERSFTDVSQWQKDGAKLKPMGGEEEAVLAKKVSGLDNRNFQLPLSDSPHGSLIVNKQTAPPLPPRRLDTGGIHLLNQTSERTRTTSSPSSSKPPYRLYTSKRAPPLPTPPPPLPLSVTVPILTPRVANAALNFKDRFVASAGGLGREWGKKGKGKLQDKLVRRNSGGYSASPFTLGIMQSGTDRSNSPLGASDNPINLPATILGVRVPRRCGMAFGVSLEDVVERTRIEDSEVGGLRKANTDEVTGDLVKRWTPAVCFRCLEYLEIWGKREEGIYRVPGSSYQIAQLRALFDAGCDLNLSEIPPSDLDPHAVASLFKSWLRELPDSLLSSNLEAAVDHLVLSSTGFPASSLHFLSTRASSTPVSGPGLVDGRPPPDLLDKLSSLFCDAMPAEEYYLLRALAYHLARLSSYSKVNKMTLANLRLILSPTMKLSPGMMKILSEERETLFRRPNESARLRAATTGLTSFRTSSSLSTANSRSNLSPRTSPFVSPVLCSAEFARPSNARHSWQLVDTPTHRTSPDPSISPSKTPEVRTPIADRFASSSDPFPTPPASPDPKATITFPNSNSFVPVRSPGAGTFFASRDITIPAPSVAVRGQAKMAVSAERGRVITLQEAMREREKVRSKSVDVLMGYGKKSGDSEQEVLEAFTRSGAQEAENLRWERKRLSQDGFENDGRLSFESSNSDTSRSTESTNSTRSTSRAAKRQSRLFNSSTSTSSIVLPRLTLPSGLGLGLAEDDGESGDSWGLLSVEERKRFFES